MFQKISRKYNNDYNDLSEVALQYIQFCKTIQINDL